VKSADRQATAFAPASIGNVGVGFDMLGLAIAGVGDRVSARLSSSPGVSIAEVRGLDGEVHPYLSRDALQNTASIAAASLWHAHGNETGVELKICKGVPLQSGMGGSAASAVAAVVAVNALLEVPLAIPQLLPYALQGEAFASGGTHADNVAPSLLGGLVFCPNALHPAMIPVTAIQGISSVVLHPEMQISTASSRKKLARGYTLEQWLQQQGYLGGFLLACERGDHSLLRRTLIDVVIEPQRADSVPCFHAVKVAAMTANALGCSLSGSGPSIFALCENDDAANIATAMEQACRGFGYQCQSWISSMNAPGAYLESDG
jgi:homoserine kinase